MGEVFEMLPKLIKLFKEGKTYEEIAKSLNVDRSLVASLVVSLRKQECDLPRRSRSYYKEIIEFLAINPKYKKGQYGKR